MIAKVIVFNYNLFLWGFEKGNICNFFKTPYYNCYQRSMAFKNAGDKVYKRKPAFAKSACSLIPVKSVVLLFLESRYGILKKLKGNLRLEYFITGGYNSRIYAYENDVLYSYSVPAFFNRGFRCYFNLHYNVLKNFSVWLR